MTNKKKNIALLLGDPSGIGPELISKLLTQNELSNANITIIGEKNILNAGDKISGNNSDPVSYTHLTLPTILLE